LFTSQNGGTVEHTQGASSTKFICIIGISFYVYRLSRTGSKITGMEKYTQNLETWDELFKKRYPTIYNKLMSEYPAKYSY
jgi:hypothetical protein